MRRITEATSNGSVKENTSKLIDGMTSGTKGYCKITTLCRVRILIRFFIRMIVGCISDHCLFLVSLLG